MIPTPPPAGDSEREALAFLIADQRNCTPGSNARSDAHCEPSDRDRMIADAILAAGFTRGRSDDVQGEANAQYWRLHEAAKETEAHQSDTIKRLERERDEARAYHDMIRGSSLADTERLIAAAEMAGVQYSGCDTPHDLADTVCGLRAQVDAAESHADRESKYAAEWQQQCKVERARADAAEAKLRGIEEADMAEVRAAHAAMNAAESKAAKLAEALRKLIAFVEATDDTVPSLAFARAALAGDNGTEGEGA